MPNLEELKIENDPRSSEPTSGFRNSLGKMTKDMTFVGPFLIVYGFFNCLTIVGLPIGIPVIFAGLKMREAADQFFFRITNNPASMKAGFDLQGSFFRIFKILIIVGICLTALFVILFLAFAAYFINRFSPQSSL